MRLGELKEMASFSRSRIQGFFNLLHAASLSSKPTTSIAFGIYQTSSISLSLKISLIMLDWRELPEKHDFASRIAGKFMDMDHLGILAIDISDTRNKRATSLEIVEGQTM